MPTEASLFNRNELVFSLLFYPPIRFNTLKSGSGKKDEMTRNHWMCSSRNHDNTSEMLRAVGRVFHQVASGISSNFKTSRKFPGSPVVRTPCSHC